MNQNIPMTPQPGDRHIEIPVTFDYDGGRNQHMRTRMMWSIAVLLGTLVFAVIMLFSATPFILKPFLIVIVLYVGVWLVRYPMLGERGYREEAQKRIKRDYVVPMQDIWSIYDIRGNVCHYRNGYKGIFVLLEKGAIVGQNEMDKHDHYSAISDALNVAGSTNMKVYHVDYMAGIGQDDRLRNAVRNLNSYKNLKVRRVLQEIFRKIQKDSEASYTTYDIYLFLSKSDISDMQDNIVKVIDCLTDANYSRYSYMDRKAIQMFAATLFNMADFSVNEATRLAFPNAKKNKITTIIERYADGTSIKVGKTKEELETERAEKALQARSDSKEIARRRAEALNRQKEQKAKAKKRTGSGIDMSEGIDYAVDKDHEGIDLTATGLFDETSDHSNSELVDQGEEIEL